MTPFLRWRLAGPAQGRGRVGSRSRPLTDYPVEEEPLAAAEYALGWFRDWETHADREHDFGGEYVVMKNLRRAVRLACES